MFLGVSGVLLEVLGFHGCSWQFKEVLRSFQERSMGFEGVQAGFMEFYERFRRFQLFSRISMKFQGSSRGYLLRSKVFMGLFRVL